MNMVVGVAGPPGAGKSTFCKLLAEHFSAEQVDYDDFQRMTSQAPEQVLAWLDRGAPFDEVVAPGFVETIRSSRKPLVVEAPLGRAWPPSSALYSKVVWLECPADLALSRKIKNLLRQTVLEDYSPEWFVEFLEQYERFVRPLLHIQNTRVRPLCELRLDASRTPEELLSAFLAAPARD